MTTITVDPTPTWQAFEELACSVQKQGGLLTTEQQTIVHMILMELHQYIAELRMVERESGSGAGILRAKRLDRLAALLRMAIPWTEDAAIFLARDWKAAGVEVH